MSFPPILNPYVVAFFHPDGTTANTEYTMYLRPTTPTPSITLTYEVYPFLLATVDKPDQPQPLNCACSTMIFALNLAHAHAKVKTMVAQLITPGFMFRLAFKTRYTARKLQLFLSPWVKRLDHRGLKPGDVYRLEFRLFKIAGAVPATVVARICWAHKDMHVARYRRKFISEKTMAELEDAAKQQRLRLLFDHRHVWP